MATHLCSLLAAYGKGIEYDKAVAVFEQMVASGERPDTTKYNILIDACIRADRPSEVTRWLAEMKERRVPFDVITFNMVIGAYAGRGDIRATEFTYKKVGFDSGFGECSYQCLHLNRDEEAQGTSLSSSDLYEWGDVRRR